ncbi:hypothetical protein CQ010_16265 [Arthrobacter sp. MYb211]|uniref:hypothetical protein n=1 Tax=unclassified Arthrobacter TaxID=235627 RepID=UPI000CFCDE0C|nr:MULTISPECIES: hypothetical protein [unclassified Arthrobacter]PRA09984.1 hypothetical protein CQ015_16250 [Arthrobacter sp. MYb221]PRC05064.1 hypothetical protein CQ010_16265 [Arthrobacter sp. MYb211]
MNAIYATMLVASTKVQNENLDENSYGPGFLGFVFTAFLALAVIFLIRDMVRRVRRVRYASEAEAKQNELMIKGENQPRQESTDPVDPKASEDS